MDGTLTLTNTSQTDAAAERHKKLKEQSEESKAKSREYYRRLRDAGKVQD